MTEKETEVTPYTQMETKDEEQILSEMKGEFLQNYVYSFTQGNRTITNLSYIGIKEAIRRRGHYQIIEQTITEVGGKIRALVKVHDLINDIDVLGASEAEADKQFSFVLAVNKAERNAFAKVIPAKLIAEMIAEKLGKKTETPKEVERSQKMPKDVTPEQLKQEGEQVPVSYQLNSWIKPDLYANLTIDEQGSDIILKPKERFEAPDFKAICAAVEHFKGKWVSVDGVWVIPNA
jgi:hypothetical protein